MDYEALAKRMGREWGLSVQDTREGYKYMSGLWVALFWSCGTFAGELALLRFWNVSVQYRFTIEKKGMASI